MVVLAVTWMAKIGRESDVTAIFDKLTAESRKESGCLMYQDDAALEAHRTAPHFLQLAKKDLPKIADRIEGHLFEPLG
jgi:quinol monooxygenase YgiN